VLEKHLGRHLNPSEVVHHINDKKHDNRIENLVLFGNHSQHAKFETKFVKRDSSGRFMRDKATPNWVRSLLENADKCGVPVFMKDNLQKYWDGELRRDHPLL